MRVGIDLGTTYCAVAYVNPASGKAEIIKNKENSSITPSVLYFAPDGTIIHGEDAKMYMEAGSEDTINYFKYHMGDSSWFIEKHGQKYTAVDLSAELLKGIVREAEERLNEKITQAVITVPAYFDHVRRMATKEAGKKAGLEVLNIINEPTAAIFAYGINGKGVEQTVMVYDLGGGTFDVSIAKVEEDEITVLGTDGNHRLGGKDWDDALADYLAELFEEQFDEDITDDISMNITMQTIAENVKKALTSRSRSNAVINYRGKKGIYEITEAVFEEITMHQLKNTTDVIEKLFSELNMTWKDIDGVLLVGGSTRMKQVAKYLTHVCGTEPMRGINVDEAVALGAAIRANIDLSGNIIGMVGSQKKNQTANNQEELFIAGRKRLKDATAHSLGMVALSEDGTCYVNSIMIPKNSPVPSQVTKAYELDVVKKEERNKLEVYILQGEEEHFTYPLNCTVTGKYLFSGILYNGLQKEIIDVTYSYDEDNLIRVSAIQRSTGQQLIPKLIEPVDEDMSWVLDDPAVRMRQNTKIPEMSIYFAIDLSGSMEGNRLTKSKEAAISFIEQFNMDYTRISLINFSDRCVVYQAATSDSALLKKKIKGWKINDNGLGYGNSAQPFSHIKEMLTSDTADVKYILVLTDGYWSFGAIEASYKLSAELKNQGIEIIALGFGNANLNFLNQLASRKDFASLTDISKLESVLMGIARIM